MLYWVPGTFLKHQTTSPVKTGQRKHTHSDHQPPGLPHRCNHARTHASRTHARTRASSARRQDVSGLLQGHPPPARPEPPPSPWDLGSLHQRAGGSPSPPSAWMRLPEPRLAQGWGPEEDAAEEWPAAVESRVTEHRSRENAVTLYFI